MHTFILRYLHVSIPSSGRDEDDVYDDTWALNMGTMEWVLVNVSGNAEVPEGRYDAAGGVYGNTLWLSMGKNEDERILSDTWVLNVNKTEDEELVGELTFKRKNFKLFLTPSFLPFLLLFLLSSHSFFPPSLMNRGVGEGPRWCGAQPVRSFPPPCSLQARWYSSQSNQICPVWGMCQVQENTTHCTYP